MKTLHVVIIVLLTLPELSAQSNNIDTLEKAVNKLQILRLKNYGTEHRDSIFSKFDSTIIQLFKNDKICSHPFDTLNHYFLNNPEIEESSAHFILYAFIKNIVICASNDRKFRVFSWDDLQAGSYHTYTNFAQYQVSKNNCTIIPIDTSEDDTEAGYYDIITVTENNRPYYFLLGYGTYGSGQQHRVVRIYEIKNNLLVECISCYPEHKPITIFSNRGQNIDLRFNTNIPELTYKEFKLNKEVGYYTDEFDLVRLKFENGVLTK